MNINYSYEIYSNQTKILINNKSQTKIYRQMIFITLAQNPELIGKIRKYIEFGNFQR